MSLSSGANIAIRLSLAIAVGLVISKPLEIKIFEERVMKQIESNNIREGAEKQKDLEAKFREITLLKNQVQGIQNDIRDKEQNTSAAFDLAMEENDGSKGTLKPGKGPVFAEKWSLYKKLDQESQEFRKSQQQKIDKLENRIHFLESQKDQEYDRFKKAQNNANGLVSQLEALDQLSEEPVIKNASWAILLFLIFLDTAPILAKTFLKRGIYDEMLDAQEELAIDNIKRKLAVEKSMNQKRHEHLKEQYMISMQQAVNYPEQKVINEQIAQEIVESTKEQLMEYVEKYRYPKQEIKKAVKDAFSAQLNRVAQSEAKQKVTEIRVNNVKNNGVNNLKSLSDDIINKYDDTHKEIETQLNGLVETNGNKKSGSVPSSNND